MSHPQCHHRVAVTSKVRLEGRGRRKRGGSSYADGFVTVVRARDRLFAPVTGLGLCSSGVNENQQRQDRGLSAWRGGLALRPRAEGPGSAAASGHREAESTELRFPHTFTNTTPTLATVAPARVLTETPHATGQAAGPAQKGPPSRLCPALRGRSADSRGGRHTCNPVTVLTQQEGGLEIQAGAAGLAKPAPSTGYRRRRAPHFMALTPSPALTSPAQALARPCRGRGCCGAGGELALRGPCGSRLGRQHGFPSRRGVARRGVAFRGRGLSGAWLAGRHVRAQARAFIYQEPPDQCRQGWERRELGPQAPGHPSPPSWVRAPPSISPSDARE